MSLSKEEISVINQLFLEAEKSIKDCENITNELPQGAVNELRYAGKHLTKFLLEEDKEELNKFYRHCKRAQYDAQELSILMLKTKIDNYLDLLIGNEDIAQDIFGNKYLEILTLRRDTNKTIIEVNNTQDNREDYLHKILEIVPLLQENLQAIEDLFPAVQSKIKKQNSQKKIVIIGAITGIIGVLIGAVTAIISN